jgi:hypothetical protein
MKSRLIFVLILVVVLVLVLALKRSGYTMPKRFPNSNTEILTQTELVTRELSNAVPTTPALLNALNMYHMNLLRPKVSPQLFAIIHQISIQSFNRGRVYALSLANQQNEMVTIGKQYRSDNLGKMIDQLK